MGERNKLGVEQMCYITKHCLDRLDRDRNKWITAQGPSSERQSTCELAGLEIDGHVLKGSGLLAVPCEGGVRDDRLAPLRWDGKKNAHTSETENQTAARK